MRDDVVGGFKETPYHSPAGGGLISGFSSGEEKIGMRGMLPTMESC